MLSCVNIMLKYYF